jgi:SAM-dependent methyltransferase
VYLSPYLSAARRYAGGFLSLLWGSPQTQAARFDAICRLESLAGRSILDVGCGRADLLDYLRLRDITFADYTGIEAVPELLEAARQKQSELVRIVDADFVARPMSLFVGADVVLISGSLNTLDTHAFYTTIRRAFEATAEAVVFNFLDSPYLAAASYLTWHKRDDVLNFARSLSRDVRVLSDYLEGDSTIAVRKEQEE